MHTGQKVTRKKENFEGEKFIRIKPKQITSQPHDMKTRKTNDTTMVL